MRTHGSISVSRHTPDNDLVRGICPVEPREMTRDINIKDYNCNGHHFENHSSLHGLPHSIHRGGKEISVEKNVLPFDPPNQTHKTLISHSLSSVLIWIHIL